MNHEYIGDDDNCLDFGCNYCGLSKEKHIITLETNGDLKK